MIAQYSTSSAHRQGSSQSRLNDLQRRGKQLMKDCSFLEEIGAEEVLRGSSVHEQLVHASKQQLQVQHALSAADFPQQGRSYQSKAGVIKSLRLHSHWASECNDRFTRAYCPSCMYYRQLQMTSDRSREGQKGLQFLHLQRCDQPEASYSLQYTVPLASLVLLQNEHANESLTCTQEPRGLIHECPSALHHGGCS